MAKIVIIGAGSHIFSRHLITDVLSYPELRDSTITLMAGLHYGFCQETGRAKRL